MKEDLRKRLIELGFDEEMINDYFNEVESYGENDYFENESLMSFVGDFEMYKNYVMSKFH